MRSTTVNLIGAFFVTLLLAAGLQIQIVGASEPSAKEESPARISYLIDRLASRNHPPDADNPDIRPRDYNESAQADVYLATQQLLHEGSYGFDTLVEHFNDRRYSCTVALPSTNQNRSVGVTCYLIMAVAIRCPLKQTTFFCVQQYETDQSFPPQDLGAWWKHARGRSLWNIQVEVIERQLKILDSLDYGNAQWPQGFDDRKRPVLRKLTREQFDSEKGAAIKSLMAMRNALNATHHPYYPDSLDEPGCGTTWLPWKAR